MSFFNDFLKYFEISSINSQTTITTIVGFGLVIIGKIKVKNIDESEIVLILNKHKTIIEGNNLNIKSISKGEIVVNGDIKNINMEKL